MKKKFFVFLLSMVTILIFSGCGKEEVQPVNAGGGEDSSNVNEQAENPIEQLQTNIAIDTNENEAIFKISLKNNSDTNIKLTFTSGQKYDVAVTNEAGNEVYRYSIDKSFIQSIEELELMAGETKTWEESWDYTTNTGERLPTGEYKVTAIITSSQVNGYEVSENDLQSPEYSFTIPVGNNAFRNVNVTGENGEYVVKGEARVFEGSFFYSVEDGHDYLVEETVYQTKEGAPAWSPFEIEISIPKEKLPKNGSLIVQLFEKSPKDGSTLNSYQGLLQQFK